jgi:hypothetical protein
VRLRSFALVAALAVPTAVSATQAPQGHDAFVRSSLITESASIGTTLFVRKRTRTTGCALGIEPDRACSPGAYEGTRTAAVLCDKAFHTGDVRAVSEGLKRQVEVEYGLEPKRYGNTLEIDHIISLELGGSNDVANLYPELAPGYHVKDVLENRLHKLVCAGKMTLHSAQSHIAADWVRLYTRVFGKAPVTAPVKAP